MTSFINDIQNNALAALTRNVAEPVMSAIETASASTGVNFAYLVQQAGVESSFNPDAKARSSSATGLYQFIESTWMKMVDRYGEKYGIESETMSRAEILSLRKDPKLASFMAAELAQENESVLERHWGGEIGATELYLAHFLGAGSAAAFLNARDESPMEPAAYLFPDAAASNRAVFYDSASGRARSLDEVYSWFDQKFKIDEQVPRQQSPVFVNTPVSETSSAMNKPTGHQPHRAHTSIPLYNNLVLDYVELMLSAQMDLPFVPEKSSHWF